MVEAYARSRLRVLDRRHRPRVVDPRVARRRAAQGVPLPPLALLLPFSSAAAPTDAPARSPLQVLTIFTSVLLIGTHAVTVACVRERILISRADDDLPPGSGRGSGALRALADVWHTIRTLPRPIQQVFNVQFTGWIGWFPVLFFSTTWVAEMYVKTQWAGGGAGSELADAPDDVRERATRAGTHAMLWHSVVSLATSIVLPPLVAAGSSSSSSTSSSHDRPSSASSSRRPTTSPLARAKALLPRIPFDWLSLPLLWAISNTLFSVLLFSTLFATSVAGASFIVAAAGFAWAVTNWAPFALVRLPLSRSLPPSSLALSLLPLGLPLG